MVGVCDGKLQVLICKVNSSGPITFRLVGTVRVPAPMRAQDEVFILLVKARARHNGSIVLLLFVSEFC